MVASDTLPCHLSKPLQPMASFTSSNRQQTELSKVPVPSSLSQFSLPMAADSELFNRTKCSLAVQRLYRATDNNSINVHRISLSELALGIPSSRDIYLFASLHEHIMERCNVEKGGQVWLAVCNEGVWGMLPTGHDHCWGRVAEIIFGRSEVNFRGDYTNIVFQILYAVPPRKKSSPPTFCGLGPHHEHMEW